MPFPRRAAALALLLSVIAGCGDDNPAGPKPAEIYGLWTATSVVYVKKSNPSVTVNLVAPDTTATCAINSDKSFVFVVNRAGQPPDTTKGTWNLDGEMFEVVPSASPLTTWSWKCDLSANTLTLTGADMWYDFNGDDQYQPDEEADNNTTLVR